MLLADASEPQDSESTDSQVTASHYGFLPDGREVFCFTLSNGQGMTAKVLNYGAILAEVLVPDRNGQAQDVVHGFETLEGWLNNIPYFGATVGRFGNRIAEGKFTLDGEDYTLALNNEPAGIPCHLHGGLEGFGTKLWEAKVIENGVELSYLSSDGEEGYPGDLAVTVTYTLNNNNELTWQAKATTTKATPINIIHHSYWNLSGDPTRSINDHLLSLNAPHYLPTSPGMIPTGELRPVAGTPMDFLNEQAIGSRVGEDYEALLLGNGYDHAWVIAGEGLRLAAKVREPLSGRTMELHTDQPAIQFYGANYLDQTLAGKKGVCYDSRTAFCLETETFPNGPNEPEFPNCILRPGETYQHTMVHKFGW